MQIYWVVSQYWFAAIGFFAGPLLYLFRSYFRVMYGAVEVVVSWAMIFLAVVSGTDAAITVEGAQQAFSNGHPLLAKVVAWVAGVYVSVRGFENMGILKRLTKAEIEPPKS